MLRYIAKRFLIGVLLIFLVSVFAFALIHMLPGDPARLALGGDASTADIEAMRIAMNLDKPLLQQYWIWISGIFTGDMGKSFTYNRPITELMLERIPATLYIGLPALLLSAVLGSLCGIISAVKRGKFVDQALTFLTTIGLGTPVFWIGIFSVYIFSVQLDWLPITGYTPPTKDFGDFLLKAILPIFTMTVGMMAAVARQARSNMIEALNQDYVRTARANGIKESSVLFKHALINALIPVISMIGVQVRIAVGGSLITEVLFNIPGIGTLLNRAVSNRDYMLIQAGVLFVSIMTVLASMVMDVLYGIVDPRIRKNWR